MTVLYQSTEVLITGELQLLCNPLHKVSMLFYKLDKQNGQTSFLVILRLSTTSLELSLEFTLYKRDSLTDSMILFLVRVQGKGRLKLPSAHGPSILFFGPGSPHTVVE